MHGRFLQDSRNHQLFHSRCLAGLQIAEGAKSFHGDRAECRGGDWEQGVHRIITLAPFIVEGRITPSMNALDSYLFVT